MLLKYHLLKHCNLSIHVRWFNYKHASANSQSLIFFHFDLHWLFISMRCPGITGFQWFNIQMLISQQNDQN